MAPSIRSALLLPFAFLLAFAMMACSKTPDKVIVGTWNLDVDSAVAELPEEQQEAAREMMSAMQMTVTFGGGGDMSMAVNMGGEAESRNGTWETVEVGEGTVKLSVTIEGDEEGDEPDTDEMQITIIDENTIRMDMAGQAMTFKRA